MLLIVSSLNAYGTVENCGSVTINEILTGPRHGAMMRVSNTECGNTGYVCLDPNGETMSKEESDRLFSFVLSNYMAGKPLRVQVYTDVYAQACGSYPVVEDVRT